MAQHEQWQLNGSAPELYERYLVPAITALWAADLVDRAAPQPGEQVLDVACGTGVVARLAAERMGTGHVVGVDINAGMLAVARSLPVGAGARIEWREGSALEMPFPDAAFDLVFCQLGLQFFPDRSVAVREMFRVLARSGRLALSVYSAMSALRRRTHCGRLGSTPRSRCIGGQTFGHTLADADELYRLVAEEGFRDVKIHTMTQKIRFPSPREYVRLQIAATPMAAMVSGMQSRQRDALVDAIIGDLILSLKILTGEEGSTSPQEAHVLLARK